MAQQAFLKKDLEDGSPNGAYVDLLDEDKPIAGQKFCCVSFASPDKILKSKNEFLFSEFLKQWDLYKSMGKFHQFLNFVSYKYECDFDSLMADLSDFVKDEKEALSATDVTDDYKGFLEKHEDRLSQEFDRENSFQTSTRGVKFRGAFSTQQEAELRAKVLRDWEQSAMGGSHDIFVGPVGMWMPWDPEPYKTGRVEHLEEELNQLMHEKQKNEAKAKEEFDSRINEAKKKAMLENQKIASESGNKLTQAMDANGNLVSVSELESPQEVSVADIRKELFESTDVVMDKKGDHGLAAVLGNEAAPTEQAASGKKKRGGRKKKENAKV
jgi:hypothetical protein